MVRGAKSKAFLFARVEQKQRNKGNNHHEFGWISIYFLEGFTLCTHNAKTTTAFRMYYNSSLGILK